jgi:hypothetical protein
MALTIKALYGPAADGDNVSHRDAGVMSSDRPCKYVSIFLSIIHELHV